MPEETQVETPSPPYISFETFRTFIGYLVDTVVPASIDRSVMPKIAGSVRVQLMPALRFLALMDKAGKPTEALHQLVAAVDKNGEIRYGERWKSELKKLVYSAYAEVVDGLDISKTTAPVLSQKFRENGHIDSTETLSKALRFYLAAQKEAGASISPHLAVRASPSAPRRNAVRRRGNDSGDGVDTSQGGGKPASGSAAGAGGAPSGAFGEAKDGTISLPVLIAGEARGEVRLKKDYTRADCEAARALLAYLEATAPKKA